MNHSPASSTRFNTSDVATRRRRWIIYITIFLLIFGSLEYGYQLTRDSWVEHLIIDTLTVMPAALLIKFLLPAVQVTADGHSLLSSVGRINVLSGCDGSEGMFLLIAAVAPFPASWLMRLAGAGFGILLMYALNQLRILAFFVVLRLRPELFESLHGFIAPTFLVMCGCLFFLLWSGIAAKNYHA